MDRIYKNITAEMEAAGPLLAGIMRMCIDRRKTRMRVRRHKHLIILK